MQSFGQKMKIATSSGPRAVPRNRGDVGRRMQVFAQQVEEFVAELDCAVESHMDWTRRVLRCSVLRSSPGADVLAPDAHCRCRFGRWIEKYQERFKLIDEAATVRLLNYHQLMHDAVRRLCSSILSTGMGDSDDLDVFEDSQVHLIAELAHFKTEILASGARIDALTGLPLRHGLEVEFARFRSGAKRLGMRAVVLMVDIDHFKRVNDAYGHGVGDEALRHVADILSLQTRREETIIRFGGEEFLRLIRVDCADEASSAAERMLQALRDNSMTLSDGGKLHLTASCGLAWVGPLDSLEHATARADHALYAAKAEGRDRWKWADAADASLEQPRIQSRSRMSNSVF